MPVRIITCKRDDLGRGPACAAGRPFCNSRSFVVAVDDRQSGAARPARSPARVVAGRCAGVRAAVSSTISHASSTCSTRGNGGRSPPGVQRSRRRCREPRSRGPEATRVAMLSTARGRSTRRQRVNFTTRTAGTARGRGSETAAVSKRWPRVRNCPMRVWGSSLLRGVWRRDAARGGLP